MKSVKRKILQYEVDDHLTKTYLWLTRNLAKETTIVGRVFDESYEILHELVNEE